LQQPFGCYLVEGVMAFPIASSGLWKSLTPRQGVDGLTTAEGLAPSFGTEATIDLLPGGAARMRFARRFTAEAR
jgi:hypothetical protein